jgi:hypothetical protein
MIHRDEYRRRPCSTRGWAMRSLMLGSFFIIIPGIHPHPLEPNCNVQGLVARGAHLLLITVFREIYPYRRPNDLVRLGAEPCAPSLCIFYFLFARIHPHPLEPNCTVQGLVARGAHLLLIPANTNSTADAPFDSGLGHQFSLCLSFLLSFFFSCELSLSL